MFSLSGALIAVLVKQLKHLPLMEIIFFQNIPTMVIVPIILKKINISLFGSNKSFLWLRGILGLLGMLMAFYSFTTMPLTDAMAIKSLNPFFIFLFSGLLLKEKLSFRQVPLFIFAFLGGLLVIKPGLRIDILPAIIALFGTITAALAYITLRYLRLTDHHLVIMNYFAYVSGIFSLCVLLFQKSFIVPGLSDLFPLILIGLVMLGTQFSLTKAYQLAPANLISLYTYSQIVFAIVFGFLFFKEIPDLLSVYGAGFIILSGYLNYRLK